MKIALIHSVRVAGPQTFGWKWRSADGAAQSADTFMYFHDCWENAQRKGYQCEYDGVAAGTGTPSALQGSRLRPQQRASRAP